MARYYDDKRRPSTAERDARVLRTYRKLMHKWGDIAPYIARTEIYRRVAELCKLTPKTIERILNHVY